MNSTLIGIISTTQKGAGYIDRPAGRMRIRPAGALGDWSRGWWDGYCPKSTAWALTRKPVRHFAEVDELHVALSDNA